MGNFIYSSQIAYDPVLPQEIQDRLEDYSNSLDAIFEEMFGLPEIPKELTGEMDSILKSISSTNRKEGYCEEISDQVSEEIRKLTVKIIAYKQKPTEIVIQDIPEVGYDISYLSEDGKKVERPMSCDEQDVLFDMEMWADQFNQLENVEAFKELIVKVNNEAEKKSIERDDIRELLNPIFKKYEQFGFSREQINNLLILAESEESFPELVPDGKEPGINKLEIMRDVWEKYLSGEEKSKYIKLAAAIIGIGAVEGMTPILFKYMMDAKTVEVAALFAGAYMAGETSLGWIRTKLGVKFDVFVNEIAERDDGLNERLSKDLAFQPGEVMAATDERGRLMTSMKRGKRAFKDILSSMAKTTGPAVATAATGLGMMMVNDWKLGLISIVSAPIAIAIARRAEKKLEPIISESYDVEDSTALEVEEQINAHMEIVLSGMRDSMGPRLEVLMKKFNKLDNDRSVAYATMDFRLGTVLNSAVTAGLTVAGVALRGAGIQESGNIVAALMYSGMFRNSFDNVVRQQSRALESCASIMEMEEVFNGYAEEEATSEKDRISASDLTSFSLDMKNVSLSLDDDEIIRDVNLSIPGGSVVRLEGMSGHGKTTLTKLMAGYYRPTNGEVEIGSVPLENIKKSGPGSIYSHIAYLSQRPYIFDSDNLHKNLQFGNHGA